ncbi:THxN family PEP-CTERM protein [Phenylobacterium sp.]|uniref:THxN family PEP-CTERM protein n=1 Tax=Phenylobacterium sp. TaxID=1871053 RepID=UPI0027357E2C|nr:THxN family PEP-CTERM protein [Phenylobacterium sp.]MDP3852394.1 THxN family PEP-CTERM protein [Phenylobacterium sp.]
MGFKSNSRNLAIAAAALVAVSAAAVTPAAAGVVVFSNVKGSWSDSTPVAGITIANGDPTSTASWGNGTAAGGYHQSSYKFTGAGAVTPDLGDGDSAGPFQIGEFQHNNWPITGASLTSIKLAFTADITVDGDLIGTKTFDFFFTHHETPNAGGAGGACAYGGVSGDSNNKFGCSDNVTVNSNSLNNMFTVGADTYTLEIAGFLVGTDFVTNFLTKESGYEEVCVTSGWKKKKKCHKEERAYDNKAGVMAEVSMITSAVPEPSTWAMMIVGFGAVGSMVRSARRRNAFVAI